MGKTKWEKTKDLLSDAIDKVCDISVAIGEALFGTPFRAIVSIALGAVFGLLCYFAWELALTFFFIAGIYAMFFGMFWLMEKV